MSLLRVYHLVALHTVLGPTELGRPLVRWLLRRTLSQIAPFFDAGFYLDQIANPWTRARAARDPALHFVLIGGHAGLAPNPDFDPQFYIHCNPDVGTKRQGFYHYVRYGRAEGRTTHRLEGRAAENPGISAATALAVVLDHARGGGSSHFLDLYEPRLRAEGLTPLRTRRIDGPTAMFVFEGPWGTRILDPFKDEDGFVSFARDIGCARIVLNHVIDMPHDVFAWAGRVAGRLGIGYEVLLHDYFLACPRVNLVDIEGRYCGLPPVETCRACLVRPSPATGPVDPAQWRASAEAFLRKAHRAVAPSADLAGRMLREFPAAHIEVFEPEDDSLLPPPVPARVHPGRKLRIVVIGALNQPKGFDVVAELGRQIRARKLPIELTVVGETLSSRLLAWCAVRVTGRYQEADLAGILAREQPDVALFPAIWPETWSFALSAAWRNRLPVIAFDIGAIADRLRRSGHGTLLPHALHRDVPELATALVAWRERHLAAEVLRGAA